MRILQSVVVTKTLAAVLFLAVPPAAQSSTKDAFPLVQTGDVEGGRIAKAVTYEGKGLYGYIDGGAELYLEYGFRKLVVQEVLANAHRVTVEIYQMKSPQAAFGIFSISRYRCTPLDTLCEWSCLARHQLQMALGNFFIRIVNGNNSEDAQSLSLRIASVLKAKIHGVVDAVPSLFAEPLLRPYRQGMKYVAGRLGLQNGFPDWSDRFDGFEGFKLFIIPIATHEGEISMGLIQFPDIGEAERFRKGVRDKSTCYVRGLGPSRLVFAESSLPPEDLKPYLDLMSRRPSR